MHPFNGGAPVGVRMRGREVVVRMVMLMRDDAVRVDRLDALMKLYVEKVMKNAASMLEQLNGDLAREQEQVEETEISADRLNTVLDDLLEELKITKRQRIREIMKRPEQETLIEETYDALEAELQKKIEGIRHQIDMIADRRNTILRVNRAGKLALEVFQDILNKDKLERNDLELMIEKIRVYEDHLEIRLRSDIDGLIRCESLETAVNFNSGTENIELQSVGADAHIRPSPWWVRLNGTRRMAAGTTG